MTNCFSCSKPFEQDEHRNVVSVAPLIVFCDFCHHGDVEIRCIECNSIILGDETCSWPKGHPENVQCRSCICQEMMRSAG